MIIKYNKKYAYILVMVILVIQNLLIFHSHYIGKVSFPWDFPMSYYPWGAFITSAAQNGIFPQWMPYESMGYPFFLQIQAGQFYLPLYIFPLFHIDYNLYTATLFQVIHVLFGSLGMLLLVRSILCDWKYSLIAAVIFQFFGGFYGNSEHSDIIRAYALSPWLLYTFTFISYKDKSIDRIIATGRIGSAAHNITQYIRLLWRNIWRLPARTLLIPIFVLLFSSGGYPGNLIAIIFVLLIYVSAQLAYELILRQKASTLIINISLLSLLSLLGIGMAAISLGPSWVFRGEFSRYTNFQSLEKMGLWIEQLPGLFLSSKTIPGEVSMNSLFITLPALIMACFITGLTLRKYWPIAIVGVVGTLMITGPKSFFWKIVTTIIPQLQYSRFPTSDYRVFIAIPLIIFAMIGLKNISENKFTRLSLGFRLGFIGLWFFQGIYSTYSYINTDLINRLGRDDFAAKIFSWTNFPSRITHVMSAVLILLLMLIVLFWIWRTQKSLTYLSVGIIIILVLLDGWRVVDDMATWRDSTETISWYKEITPLYKNGNFSPNLIFVDVPTSRPARTAVDHPHHFSWRGYIDGSYMMSDYKACPTKACVNIGSKPIYWDYMLQPWKPILLSESAIQNTQQIAIPDAMIQDATINISRTNIVKQAYYGVNEVNYQVNINKPMLMVENETYFPGWEGVIENNKYLTKLKAVEINEAFRGWQLPAGSYSLKTKFVFPDITVYITISVLASIIWILVVTLNAWVGASTYS